MISVEDNEKAIEARDCDSCACWHKHCQAECCKMINLNVDKTLMNKPGELLRVKVKPLSPSDQWYYRLHDVSYNRGILAFKKNRITVMGNKLVYLYSCDYLDDDNLCKGHPDKKPEICREFTLESVQSGFMAKLCTMNCLYRYK